MQVGKKSLVDGFFKVKVNFLLIMFANMSKPCLDFVLAITPIMDETVPWIMYWRESFTGSRRFLLIQWLLMGNVISYVYKGALLSSLIAIRYTEPLDTLFEMDISGIPFYCPKNTVICWLLKTDPRTVVKNLNERRWEMPFPGYTEDKYYDRYYIKYLYMSTSLKIRCILLLELIMVRQSLQLPTSQKSDRKITITFQRKL